MLEESPTGTGTVNGIGNDAVEEVVRESLAWLENKQAKDGHWVFELEADATIPAEYILLNHYLDEINDEVEQKLAAYLRKIQGDHGGWPLFHDGGFDMSASVKAYYALKLVGDDVDAPHMKKARQAILDRGGAAKSNVFTRITLYYFRQVPRSAIPVIRPEAMFLPRWAPFHVDKVSYWSRTVMVPLFVLVAMDVKAKNPRGVDIRELFVTPPEKEKNYFVNPTGSTLGDLMLAVDRIGRFMEPVFPKILERKAIDKCMKFVRERLNGEDGLGGIFPAMANALMAFEALGYDKDHPDRKIAREAVDKLLVLHDDWGYCQPCLSPIWDTALAAHAAQEAGVAEDSEGKTLAKANQWLVERQILNVKGDWTSTRPDIRPGGWAFQYWNDYYPDVDDTAVVGMALHRADPDKYKYAIERAAEWIIGMQSKNGGWGAFDADNEHYFLDNIPFADHGALLDPPTADVSARCVSFLCQIGYDTSHQAVRRGLDFLYREQEEDGSWFGRWGTNYVYGTWSALSALNMAGEDMTSEPVRNAVDYLKNFQQPDGGWGEDCATYWPDRRNEVKESTPSQTAWAVLALMAAGEVESEAVERGVNYLLNANREGGHWEEHYYNAVGFPRVFYLRYHGYSSYFPLWALARYKNLKQSNAKKPIYGM